MRVCGVELKGAEAVLCLLDYKVESFYLPDCRQQSMPAPKIGETEATRKFYFAFQKLMEDYKVDHVVIIERHHKGKFAGSAASFKLEALIQLCEQDVSLISPGTIKAQLKRNPPMADFDAMGLKKFQKPAFEAAYAFHNEQIFGQPEE
ncbi:DUF3010 family protein [Ferrimonas pelagia]|uniref:DUF3010 family protein n=1 Tax=Ferrimonas pelagia TaxID=1177826 RepID=A0ABP9EDG4_9GAMM